MVGMVSYTKLYADYNFDQCRLIPDFADTSNIEASFGDVGFEEIKILPTDQQVFSYHDWPRVDSHFIGLAFLLSSLALVEVGIIESISLEICELKNK